jgi:PAS domain S-box-containing protein
MRIRTLFLAVIIPVVVGVNLAYASYLVAQERERSMAALGATITGNERLLGVVIAGPLYDGDIRQLGTDLDAFFADPNIVAMELQEYHGDIHIARARQAHGAPGQLLSSKVVVVRGRDQLGEIRTTYSTGLIEAELVRSRDRVLGVAALLAILLSLVIYQLAQRITGPIARLNEAAGAIAGGQLDRPVAAGGAREIASLAESFVRMRDAIRARVADLATSNELLRRENEARQTFAALVEKSSDFISFARLDGTVEFVNPAGLRLVGLPSVEEARRHRIPDYCPPEDLLALGVLLQALQSAGSWLGEFRLRRFDTGALIPVEMGAFRIDDPATGAPMFIANVSRDMTERKRSEEEKGRLQAQLNQAQKMEAVGRLAGGVAHDFNNLLTVINGNAELASDDPGLSAETREALEIIRQAGGSAAGLTKQLLAFSRKQVLQPRVLDLNDLVSNMNKMLGRVIGEDVRLAMRLAGGLWPVRVDPGQLEQVLVNLAVNARDAMSEGGTLSIETANVTLDDQVVRRHADARPGPYTMLAVSDTGHGMDPETQRRIFEPFFSTKGERGTGLGLSTVYGIVQQSGGLIHVYSEPGQGTTFRIYLPRQAGPVEQEEVAPAPTPVRARGETILVAEDSDGVRRLVRSVLTEAGFRVLEARNGEEAIQIAAEHQGRIDLLLTDVVMPVVSGRSAAELISASRPETRVLFMSGYTEDTVLTRRVLEAGVDFLEKPFSPAALAKKVQEVLAAPTRPPGPAA